MRKNIVNRERLNRPFILISVMLGMFLSAIEGTIVATVMPNIVAELGGFSLYSWVFSAYLLTAAATVLIYGKLADVFGRKPIYLIGISIFLVGSTLAGFSKTMYMLIGTRFLQGLGAGALMSISTTIVGDIYEKEQRAKVQGYLSAVWGVSAVSGPLLGGFFVEFLDWRFVFWMNIPLGILAMLGITLFLHEDIKRKEQTIDYAGAIYIFIAVSVFMYILVEGGIRISWNSPLMIALLLITTISFSLFIRQQIRAKDPMMPMQIWKHRMIFLANITSLTTGMILIGVSSYLPTFVQGVMGKTATIAGFTLTMMSIGWPIAATIGGCMLLVIGYRITSIIGAFALIIGSILFYFLSPENGPVWAGIGSFFIGIGMGLTSTSFIVGIQSSVGWEIRGVATATMMFMRSLGSALGVALLGSLLNNKIKKNIIESGYEESLTVDSMNILLDPEKSTMLSEQAIAILQEGLTSGLHSVYLGIFILALISFLFIYKLPKM